MQRGQKKSSIRGDIYTECSGKVICLNVQFKNLLETQETGKIDYLQGEYLDDWETLYMLTLETWECLIN